MNELDAAASEWIRDTPGHWECSLRPRTTIDALLGLAAVAAHASHRQAAPVSCWLASSADVSLDDAIRIAKDLAATD